MRKKECSACKKEGHESYEGVRRVSVFNLFTRRYEKVRANLCGHHQSAYEDGGFRVSPC